MQESIEGAIKKNGSKLFQYSTTEGYLPLREMIAAKYRRKFNLDVNPEDVLITNGSQQALELLGKVILNKGDQVLMEEPGYLGAIQAFSLCEPQFLSVTLEEDGLDLVKLEEMLKTNPVKLIYCVPNFQNPTGLTYSLEKRKAMRDIVSKYDVAFIEDDPYGELRFRGESLPYIGAGHMENSILLGTFSKTVTPGYASGFSDHEKYELMRHLVTAKQGSDPAYEHFHAVCHS